MAQGALWNGAWPRTSVDGGANLYEKSSALALPRVSEEDKESQKSDIKSFVSKGKSQKER